MYFELERRGWGVTGGALKPRFVFERVFTGDTGADAGMTAGYIGIVVVVVLYKGRTT